MSSVSKSFQSNFGFHPCNIETYRKLRFLHKHYWLGLRQFHGWYRWFRKEPQNRRGDEPRFCTAFVQDVVWFKPYSRKGENGYKIYPRKVVDLGILELYQLARSPQAKLVQPFDDTTLSMIDKLYREVTEHLANDKNLT